MEIHQSSDGTELAVRAATWELNPRISFESLSPELRKNPVKFWRNYGSHVGTGATNLAIKDPRDVDSHRNLSRADPWNYRAEKFFEWFIGRPNRKYYMHFDLAKNKDRAGVACVHREPTGVVVVDFMYGHAAKPGQNIVFAELRQYIYDLHARGFTIKKITYDQWNSEETRQILEGQGWETGQESADKTAKPYDTLIEMMLTDRLDYYNYPLFITEMKKLRTDGAKFDHPKDGCFVGETRIPLLDGTFPTMAELAGREVLLWASQSDGRVVPARARGRFTKMATELVDVVLDSGAIERCTPDHLWRLFDGSYLPASELRFKQRLMPLHWGFVKGDYLRLSDKTRNRVLAHQLVYEHFHGVIPEGCIVHHLDHSKRNNHPLNLKAQERSDHCRYHTALRHQTDPAWRGKLYEGARKFNESTDGRAKHAAAIRRTTELRVASRRYNHQVWAVIPVHLDHPVPAFDLEVDDHANFALASGVFVHNSKDVADAVACATFTAINDALENPPEEAGVIVVKRPESFQRRQKFYERYERVKW